MDVNPINDPVHWRKRASDARRQAEDAADEASKETLRQIARSYEHIAEIAERRMIDGNGRGPKPGM